MNARDYYKTIETWGSGSLLTNTDLTTAKIKLEQRYPMYSSSQEGHIRPLYDEITGPFFSYREKTQMNTLRGDREHKIPIVDLRADQTYEGYIIEDVHDGICKASKNWAPYVPVQITPLFDKEYPMTTTEAFITEDKE
jgi:hypothetical protein